MAQASIPRSQAEAIFAAIEQALRDGYSPPGLPTGDKPGAVMIALRRLFPDLPYGTCQSRYRSARKVLGRDPNWEIKPAAKLEYPVFPDARVPTDQLIERMSADFERRNAAEAARKWFQVKVKQPGPIGIAWLGDPHVDDNGCNWPLLRRHLATIRDTPGMFAANLGDVENNWAGRLAHLYAAQDTSKATAKQLVEWLFGEAGVEWIVLLLGNHDVWGGNGDALSRIARGGAPMADWAAQFRLTFANGREARIWASHDFPGHSMWNPLHGPTKAARFTGAADLYICGHKHNWALAATEDDHRNAVYWTARARGYKFLDDYAMKLGHGGQEHGAAIVSVIDPEAEGPAFLSCFADVGEAAEYLTWKRQRWETKRRAK